MKLNNKILALLLVFIAIVSISAVSATDVADDVVAASIDDSVAVESSIEGEDTLGATHEIAADATVSDIEAIIANTTAGDTLNFAENATYNFGELSNPIAIEHTLILQGNGATIKGYQGFIFQADDESVAGSQVYNLNFEMTNPILWNGRALDFEQGKDYIVDGCSFKNGNSGIYVRRAAGNVTLQNNYFFADEGATNKSTITGNFAKQETGAKAINLMGGSGIKIINNIFEGDYLDAMSIASGAANVEMYNNTATDVWYGVFYGGGITNITMNGNIFNNSKAFAVGIIKAAGNSDISENTFVTEAGKSAIYVEEGNTAHGAPSNIETILIYDNEFLGADSTAVSASSKGGFITPKGEFKIVDNSYDEGVTVFSFTDNNTYTFETNDLVVEANNVTIERNVPIIESDIVFINDETEFKFGELLNIMLLGKDNVILGEENVEITITSGDVTVATINATTDKNGIVKLPLLYNQGNYNLTVSYAGGKQTKTGYYKGDEDTTKFTITSLPVIIVGKDITLPTATGYRYEITLKDENNMLLTNRTVQITLNGVTYNRTTNANGIAGQNIRSLNMGQYNATTTYTDGNKTYTNTNVLTVVQANTTIKSTPTTYTYGASGNRFEAQLVDQVGKPITAAQGGVICFHINGVNYYKATNNDGKAFLNIKLQPGIYNMYMSFDGTLLYAASNGGSQVTVQ